MQPRLFDPPTKPRLALSDEEIAIKVVVRLIDLAVLQWHFERNNFSEDDRDDMVTAMMANDTDDHTLIDVWLEENRPHSNWQYEDKSELLANEYHAACESVLPSHQRCGRFA